MSNSPPEITIRPEQPADVGAIAEVVEAAFGSPVEARLVAALRASESFIPELSLVAELDGRIVGHVMITYATLHDDGDRRPIASLSPLAVEPELQGLGIGSALVREVIARADDRGEGVVVLEGNPAFYGRFGFEHSAPLGIRMHLPDWAPPEAAQLVRLRAYDPAQRGVIVYPPAFDEALDR